MHAEASALPAGTDPTQPWSKAGLGALAVSIKGFSELLLVLWISAAIWSWLRTPLPP